MKKEYIGYENNLNLIKELKKSNNIKILANKSWQTFKLYQKILSK